jgi:asparagine synthase (glutamine-hydrolysing)
MCGFVGTYSPDRSDLIDRRLREAMGAIAHRGPDSNGTKHLRAGEGYLSLGFHRLAIVDLSDLANQPFMSDDGRFSLVFNGEIYNYLELRDQLKLAGHTFKTNSDTEVLLAAWSEWGVSSINRFIGMFSFVLTDHSRSKMYCVKDAFGIKPMFYSYTSRSFSFASEIPALRIVSGNGMVRNENATVSYLLTGRYDVKSETFFEGIYNLPPGHLIIVSLENSFPKFSLSRWWKPEVQSMNDLPFDQAVERLREEFLASVKMHLRSDVKVATALSGGIDSSAIVGAIRHLKPETEINTFSFVGGSGPKNEGQWIEKANREFGAKGHLITIGDSDFVEDSDKLICLQGEPFGSTSIYAQFRVFQEAQQHGVKVMLDGQGSDEIFAGYHGYPENYLVSKLDSRDIAGAISFIYRWGKLPNRSRSQLVYSFAKSVAITFQPLDRGFDSRFLRLPDFFLGNFTPRPSSLDYLLKFDWTERRLTQRLLYEQNIGILPALLRHLDRNSMHWSIESRVPFLTPGLVKLGLGVPEQFLVSESGITKNLLRHALRGLVSQEIIFRRDKVGFETPQDEWLRSLIATKSEVLDGVKDFEYLSPVKTRKFLVDSSVRKSHQASLFWRTYNLVRWNQLFFNK